jgi:hypothetical protein
LIDVANADVTLPSNLLSARFIDKPWLADFAGFVSSHPDGRWVVGKSDPLKPALSPAEAARRAREAAADEVARLVRAKVDRGFHRSDPYAHEVVMRRMVEGNEFIADRFPQSFDRGYGTIYREAVLIDASDEALQPLVDEIAGLQHHDRNSRARTFFGGLAVIGMVFVLYRLANFFTRGFFTWKLRGVAAIIIVGALVVLAHLP